MPMSKPNVPKFVCCIHVSVPNTYTYSAIRPASATAGASTAGACSVGPAWSLPRGGAVPRGGSLPRGGAVAPSAISRDRGSTSPDGVGSASGGVVVAALSRARKRRNDCANTRERVSTAGVYGQNQGQWWAAARSARRSLPLGLGPGPASASRRTAAELRRDELVEVPIQDRLQVARLDPGPVVFDHLVGVQYVRADLVAKGDFAPLAAQRGQLLLPLLPRALGQPRRQDLQRDRLVGKLRTLVLHGDHYACRLVRDANRRIRRVDALATWAGGPVDIDPPRMRYGAAVPGRTGRSAPAGGFPPRPTAGRRPAGPRP